MDPPPLDNVPSHEISNTRSEGNDSSIPRSTCPLACDTYWMTELMPSSGVARTGVGVAALEGRSHVEVVRLEDGSEIPADLVVVGVGVTPATDWLDGSGLELRDGLVCDRYTLPVPPPGVPLAVTVDLSRPSDGVWLVVGTLLVLSAIVMVVHQQRQSGRARRPSEEATRLAGKRDRHLREILALEKKHENGDLSDPVARERREQLLAKARALQEIIDEMAEPG